MYDDNDYRPFGSGYASSSEATTNSNIENGAGTSERSENFYSHIPQDKPKKKKSGGFKKGLGMIALGLVFGIFAGTGMYAVNLFTAQFDNKTEESIVAEVLPQIDSVTPITESNGAGVSNATTTTVVTDVSKVVEECMPSIVAINNKFTQTYQSFFGPQTAQGESSGSGIIVGENDDELLIATNNHVIDEADELSVRFIDEKSVDAYVKGTDPDVDLAIIAIKRSDIEPDTMNSIKVAKLGDSDALKVGEPAVAIGNALGYGQSVTAGVISAVDREVDVENISNKMIQTDAAINPGNSGGALINIKGEVIGINEMKIASTSVEGVSYAIPISSAEPILAELMNRKVRNKVDETEAGFLGIAGVDVTSEISTMYGMPEGVYVASVTEGSAAEKAGMYKGYIITKFDGQKVSTMEGLRDLITYYPVGETVDVTVQVPGQTGYTEQVIAVTLGHREG